MDYDTFWSITFGDRSADDVVFDFDLADVRDDLDEWLGGLTAEAALMLGAYHPDREAYAAAAEKYHGRALEAIEAALVWLATAGDAT
ncbi:MAG: hypothetical protein HOP09_14535 [Hyphomicrobium sp.]|nr:hypothetical protein [Hyphomicrobium sp.]